MFCDSGHGRSEAARGAGAGAGPHLGVGLLEDHAHYVPVARGLFAALSPGAKPPHSGGVGVRAGGKGTPSATRPRQS